ncbi:MAG: ATP-binding protein [Planctomycetia bacterium]|nr:ATP-binding protein [Planctomycetia bacterium]
MKPIIRCSIVKLICQPILLLTAAAASEPPAASWTSAGSATAIESQLQEIADELASLAHPRLMTGVGPIGYRSQAHATANQAEWIEIELKKATTIDAVIIVPALYHTPDSTLEADGFPADFRIVAADDHQHETVLASFTAADGLLPRKAPLLIDCPSTVASRVRLEATRLTPRSWDGQYCLQLAEVLVFSGEQNVALNQSVTCSSTDDNPEGARDTLFVVDGFVPYLIDAQEGKRSIAFLTHLRDTEPCSITIDLGQSHQLDGLRLHAADVSDNVPQSHANNFGIPRHLKIDGATTADFAKPILVADYRIESSLATGPAITLSIPPTNCRFVRLTSLAPSLSGNSGRPFFGFAEIECLVEGRNVAVGAAVSTSLPIETLSRPDRLQAITDGNNYYGTILPVRSWLSQLARRHDLETEQPLLRIALADAYQRQSEMIQRLTWLSLLLVAAVVAVIAVERAIRQRAIFKTREQIAADLHDELGANLHALALYGDLATDNIDRSEKLSVLIGQMRDLAKRCGKAAKACVNLLESEGLYDGLVADLNRESARLLADLDHTLTIEGHDHLTSLAPKNQIGIALFYRECLTNIIRHSGATRVETELLATDRELVLSVLDNGCGLGRQPVTGRGNQTPTSLARRARLLGGSVVAADRVGGGTRVTLRTRTQPRWPHL